MGAIWSPDKRIFGFLRRPLIPIRSMNKQLIFAKRPVGPAGPDTWSLETQPVPVPGEGQILIQLHYVSLDPAMRGWMNEGKSYIAPMEIGSVMRAGAVGQVIEANNHPTFKKGDFVSGPGGVQQYVVSDGKGFHGTTTPKLDGYNTYNKNIFNEAHDRTAIMIKEK